MVAQILCFLELILRTNRVLPGIIVHERNSNSNLFVIELKTANQDFECDVKKLELFTRKDKGYKYKLGLHIEFENRRPKLRWFRNGKCATINQDFTYGN